MGKLEPFAIAIVFVIVGPWSGTIVDQGSDAWWHTSCSLTDIIRALPLTSSDLHWKEDVFFVSLLICFSCLLIPEKKTKTFRCFVTCRQFPLDISTSHQPPGSRRRNLKIVTDERLECPVEVILAKTPKNFWWVIWLVKCEAFIKSPFIWFGTLRSN